MSSLRENDELIFVTKEELHPSFFEKLLEDSDEKMELATNNHDSIAQMIRENKLIRFPIKWRK